MVWAFSTLPLSATYHETLENSNLLLLATPARFSVYEDLERHLLTNDNNHIPDTIVNKISNGGLKTNSVDLDDDEDSAQDLEGSADQPLDF